MIGDVAVSVAGVFLGLTILFVVGAVCYGAVRSGMARRAKAR